MRVAHGKETRIHNIPVGMSQCWTLDHHLLDVLPPPGVVLIPSHWDESHDLMHNTQTVGCIPEILDQVNMFMMRFQIIMRTVANYCCLLKVKPLKLLGWAAIHRLYFLVIPNMKCEALKVRLGFYEHCQWNMYWKRYVNGRSRLEYEWQFVIKQVAPNCFGD